MQAEWSVEAGAEDPMITVPWAAPDGRLQFVDLRQKPECVEEIAEALAHPALRALLTELNSAGSEVWTAKCDAWALTEEERETVAAELDTEPEAAGFGSYLDVLLRDRTAFNSFAAHEQLARTWTDAASRCGGAQTRVEFVVRPAIVEDSPGFAMTVYVLALCNDSECAYQRWGRALGEVAAIICARRAAPADGTMSMRASSSIG